MISKILYALESGFKVMQTNSRILFVGVLVFIFPLLFFWISQSFFTTSLDNINTAEKQRVGILHDTISFLLTNNNVIPVSTVQELLDTYKVENSNLTKLRVLESTDEGLVVVAADNHELIGTFEQHEKPFLSLSGNAKSAPEIYPIIDSNNNRVWQVFRVLETDTNTFYVFTEHSFNEVDTLMSKRRQQSYFGLTAIFIFLIALAYWVNSQTNWAKKYAKIEIALEERDKFTNMIAHEFRTPLTAIKGYASFLKESDSLEGEESRFVNNISTSTERLVLLVNDFLEVARIQSGKLGLNIEKVNVTKTVERVVENLQPIAIKKELELKYEDGAKDVFLKTDEKRLIQILTNIVTNAIKYTDKGSVTIDCTQNIDSVVFKVKDTGTGISANDQKLLFTPFTRVGNVDRSTTTGTGLGMWITQQLVSILGGTIGVESIEGLGTHVVISFDSKIHR